MSLADSLVDYFTSNPEQLELLGLRNTASNRLFAASTLLQDPLSPLWTSQTQQALVRIVLKRVVGTLLPQASSEEIDQIVVLGSRMYPSGTLSLLHDYPAVVSLIGKYGIGITEEVPPFPPVNPESSPLDLVLTRALIAQSLESLSPYVISEQLAIVKPNPDGYPTTKGETGLALWIIDHGVGPSLHPDIRQLALTSIVHAAIVQLLRDPNQQTSVAAINGLVIDQPERMYRALIGIDGPKVLPRGTYALATSIPGVANYLSRTPEVGDTSFIMSDTRTIVDRAVDFLIQNYGLDPQLDKEIGESLRRLSHEDSDSLILLNVALIIGQVGIRDPTVYYSLAYANRMDPLRAFLDQRALTKAVYPQGTSRAIKEITGRDIRLKELIIDGDSPVAARAARIFTDSQMLVAIYSLLSPFLPNIDLDSVDSNKLVVIFVTIMTIVRDVGEIKGTYRKYVDMLF